jgi:DNA-binding MarR family transcriptional regulator
MRAFELSRATQWEKSRLSHHLTRMEKRGLIRKESCEARYPEIAITEEGQAAIRACAPTHAALVREFFVDVFGPDRLAVLGEVSDEIVETIGKHLDRDCPPEVRS